MARRTNALDHSDVSALRLVEGLPTRCGKKSNKEVAISLQWQSPLFTQPSPPPQDHPGGVSAATGSQSIATSIERNTFGAGVDVARASSVSPGPVRGPLVDGVGSGTGRDPHTADRAAEQLVVEPVIAESNVGTADRAAKKSVIAVSGVLVQGVGHDEFPVEEQIFDGVPYSEVSLGDRGEGGGRGSEEVYSLDGLQLATIEAAGVTDEYVIPAYRPVVVGVDGAAEKSVAESVAAESDVGTVDSSSDAVASVDRARAKERWRKQKLKEKKRSRRICLRLIIHGRTDHGFGCVVGAID